MRSHEVWLWLGVLGTVGSACGGTPGAAALSARATSASASAARAGSASAAPSAAPSPPARPSPAAAPAPQGIEQVVRREGAGHTADLLVVQGGFAFLGLQGRIVKVPIAGGVPVDLAPIPKSFTGSGQELFVDATGLYWAEAKRGVITVGQAGGVSKVLAAADGTVGHVVTDDTYAYWWTDAPHGPSVLHRAPKAGGTVEDFQTGDSVVLALAVDDTRLFWSGTSHGAHLPHEFFVASMPKAGGTPTRLPAKVDWVQRLVLEGEDIYAIMTRAEDVQARDATKVVRLTKAGDGLTVLAVAYGADNIVTDGKALYWAAPAPAATHVLPATEILKLPFGSGSAPTKLVEGRPFIVALALDTERLYWAEHDDETYAVLGCPK
ncbi:MAG: hypothetical protein IT373_04225 [Polyangiaceae bacterium]|nr:hypothetical protein [Polyangiaceae bacterium]